MSFTPVAGEPILSNAGAVFGAIQSAKGTAASTAQRKLQTIQADSLNIDRETGKQKLLTGELYTDVFEFVKRVAASGSPTFHATFEDLTWALAAFFGNETFTAASGGDPAEYVFTSAGSSGPRYVTIWGGVGEGERSIKHQLIDGKFTKLEIEGGESMNSGVTWKPDISALRSKKAITDPTGASTSTSDSFAWPQISGSFKIAGINGGAALDSVTKASAIFDSGFETKQGSGIEPYMFVPGDSSITAGATLLLDEVSLALFNRVHYGSDQPAAGTSPTEDVFYGALEYEYTYGSGADLRSVKFEFPRVAYELTGSVGPNPAGGELELEIAGDARLGTSGEAHVTVTCTTGDTDAAAYLP